MQIESLSVPTSRSSPVQAKTENVVEAKAGNAETEKKQLLKVADKKDEKIDKTEDLKKLETALADYNISLRFSQDKETKELVVKLVNDKTGESILQIPSEVSLKLAADFVKLQGQFVDEAVK